MNTLSPKTLPEKAMQYMTHDQDRVDQVCAQVYGQQSGVVEAIFACNPQLADYGSYLPAGVMIDCPPLSSLSLPNALPHTIHLWD